jgi:HEAT repeat protein/outer membrane protein assembly factor BamB
MDRRVIAGLAGVVLCCQGALADGSGGYRGPQSNGVYPAAGLLKTWPKEGPAPLWKYPMEQGYAGVAVADGRVYIASGLASQLYVFDLDGAPVDQVPVGPASWKRFGGTRSTPLVSGGVAVTTTPDANIYAIDLQKRAVRWKVNAWKNFGSGKGDMGWGYPESPLLHDDMVIFNAVSRVDDTPPIVALDAQTGTVVWSADAGTGRRVSASDVSGAAFRHRGRDLVVYPTWRYLLCLEAHTGKELWAIAQTSSKNLTPVYDNDLLLWSPGSRAQMLELAPDARSYKVLWTRSHGASGFSHAVMLSGRLYMFSNPYLSVKKADPLADTFGDKGIEYELSSSDADAPEEVRKLGARQIAAWREEARRTIHLVCLDARTGKLLHSVPAGVEGHIIAADGMVYATDLAKRADDVVTIRVRLIQPTKDGFAIAGELLPKLSAEELCWASARTARSPTHLQWAREDYMYQRNVNPTIAEGRLFLRYGPLMVFDLRGGGYRTAGEPPRPATIPTQPPAPGRVLTTQSADIANADLPVLLGQLGNRFEEHRRAAVALIGRLDATRSRAIVPKLVDLVASEGDRAWLIQKGACDALKAMGSAAKGASPPLCKLLVASLQDRDGPRAEMVLAAIQAVDANSIPPTVAAVAALLGHSDRHIRRLAAVALGRMGPAAQGACKALAGAVLSDDERVAMAAGASLGAMATAAKQAAPALASGLIDAVQRKRSPWCGLIMDALACIDPNAVRTSVPPVAAMLGHKDADVRLLAARTLKQVGAGAVAAIPALVEAMKSDDAQVAKLASEALAGVGSASPDAALAMARLIDQDQGTVRLAAAEVIVQMGPTAAPTTDLLAKALKDKDLRLARLCAKALGAIGPGAKGAVGALAEALAHRDPELAGAAAAALGAIGPDAKPAATALLVVLGRADQRTFFTAATALTQVGQPPLPALVNMLGSGKGQAATLAADALGRLGPEAKPAVPALAKALAGPDKRLAAGAARALGTIGGDAKDSVPALLAALNDADGNLVASAAGALAKMGAEAKDVLPALIKAVGSTDDQLAVAAVNALTGFGKAAEPAVGPLVAASKRGDGRLTDAIRRALPRLKTKNAPPRAQDQTVTCQEGKSTDIDLAADDPDDIAAGLSVSIVDPPRRGKLQPRGKLTFAYIGEPDFVGGDSFTWKASDGPGESNLARASVVVAPDTTAPRIAKVIAQGPADSVAVTFDEPVTASSAQKAGNYAIDNGVSVLKAQLDEAGRIATLTTSPLSEITTYTLTVRGITDRAKAATTGDSGAAFVHKRLVQGLTRRRYDQVLTRGDLRLLDAMKPTAVDHVDKLSVSVPEASQGFSQRFDGLIRIERDGEYVFHVRSSGAARLYVGTALVVNADAGRDGQDRSGKITLTAGMHVLTVTYCHPGGPVLLEADWSGPSFQKQAIPPAALFRVPVVDHRPS